MYVKKMFIDESGSLSYLVGCIHEGTGCVVNPKRDVREYLDTAHDLGLSITHIFDTRRPEESYLSGNMELMLRTGAQVHYLNRESFQINRKIAVEGDVFDFGNARLEIIESPRHDLYSGTIRVTDRSTDGEPSMILGRESLMVVDLSDSDLSGTDLTEELSYFMDSHARYVKPSAMDDTMCDILPGFGGGDPVYASSF